MKNLLPLVVVLLFALGACTEEIIRVEKQTDTVTVEKFIDRYFAGTDTVEIPVIVEVPTPTRSQADTVTVTEIVHDTIWMHRIDSVWITETTTIYDTVVQVVHHYGDTLIVQWQHNTYDVSPELQPLITEFYKQAFAHGMTPNGGEMIAKIVHMDAVLQAYSLDFFGQALLRVNDNLTADERLLPVWREMARMTLGKEYSQTPGDYMYPFTNANSIRVSSPQSEKEKFWNEIILSE